MAGATEVSDDMVNNAWMIADRSGSGDLDEFEFARIFEIGSGPPKNEYEKPDWYWRLFVQD